MEGTPTVHIESYTLNNGLSMPKVGLGTYGMKDIDEIYSAIVDCGYRHIDTASMYENETEIGQALQKVRHLNEE